MTTRKPNWTLRIAIATVLLVAATSANAQTPIKFSLDWKFEGPAAPFLVALDKGLYKKQGLDVTIDTANGSLEPLNRVASGTYDMGFGDINSLIKFRDANPNMPIKAVFMVYNKPPFAIIGRKSRGVSGPKDLEGKKLGAPVADSAFAQWKIFTQANNIDTAKVTVENIGFPVREPMLAAGQVDAVTGFPFTIFFNLRDRGTPADDISIILMADHGVNLYGNAIMVNSKFAADNPDAVRKFLIAFTEGMRETLSSPDTAIESVVRRNDIANRAVELDRLKMTLGTNIMTPEVKQKGLGQIDPARMDQSIEQIGLTYSFKNGKPKATDIFDSSFMPKSDQLKM